MEIQHLLCLSKFLRVSVLRLQISGWNKRHQIGVNFDDFAKKSEC